jgi:hypothetical protein
MIGVVQNHEARRTTLIADPLRHGVPGKSAVAIEQLGITTRVAFEKTGTLTDGTRAWPRSGSCLARAPTPASCSRCRPPPRIPPGTRWTGPWSPPSASRRSPSARRSWTGSMAGRGALPGAKPISLPTQPRAGFTPSFSTAT